MNIAPRKIIGTFLIGFIVVGFAALGYFVLQKEGGAGIFRAELTGVSVASMDPLKSGLPCYPSGTKQLEMTGGTGNFDWYATPAANVLTMPGGTPSATLPGAGSTITFVAPKEEDPNFATKYSVEAVVAGTEPGQGGGEIFEVNIGPSCVESIEFVSPKGSVAPVNGVITLDSIRATFSNGVTTTYQGSDIGNLGIDFVSQPEDLIQMNGNKINVPAEHSGFSIIMQVAGNRLPPVVFDKNNVIADADQNGIYPLTSDEVNPDSVVVYDAGNLLAVGTDYLFNNVAHDEDPATNDSIQLTGTPPYGKSLNVAYFYRDSNAVLKSSPLMVAGLQCELLQANLYQGRGQGFYLPQPGDNPSTGSTSIPFNFGDIRNPIKEILISNPNPQGLTFGSTNFEYRYTFNSQLPQRAVLANKVNNTYEIGVKSESDPAKTASNFAFAVNSITSDTTPFIAYADVSNTNRVILVSTEVGAHTNSYTCSVNGGSAGTCFSGGTTGTSVTGTGIQELDPPLPLDPVMNQGETRVIYSRGGIGNLKWNTADASIASVSPLSKVSEVEEMILTNENVDFFQTLGQNDFTKTQTGATIASTAGGCTYEPIGDTGLEELQSCLVSVSVPVTFNFDGKNYPITITPKGEQPKQGTIQGTSNIELLLTGQATIDAISGGTLAATGNFTAPADGDAIGTVTGTVKMQIAFSTFLTPEVINNVWSIQAITGELKKGNLVPTVEGAEAGPTVSGNFAVLTAKRPGHTTLFVSDSKGCTAPLEIEVLAEELFIDFENSAQGEFFEAGDIAQLRAWTGFKSGMSSENDVTNLATWEVDTGGDVVSISKTGLLQAIKPGVATVFARYSTGVTETGDLISQGSLLVRVNELNDLTISLDKTAIAKLSTQEQEDAYKSVAIAIHQPDVAGPTLTVEGQNFNLFIPVPTIPYASEIDQINSIMKGLPDNPNDGLLEALKLNPVTSQSVKVTAHPSLAGVLLLEPTSSNENGMIDISTTAPADELTILPLFSGTLELIPNETYQMRVVGEYDNGRTRLLPPTDVLWAGSPVNVVNGGSLEAGLLKAGEGSGIASVFAQFTTFANKIIKSNILNVNVVSGPVIEFLNIIGAEAITKGSRVELLARIRDIDTIDDLKEITVSLVKTGKTTYGDILNDPNAVWFQASPFLNEATVEPIEPPKEGQTPTNVSLTYRNFSLPVEIPVDANLFDGPYKLVLFVADTSGKSASFVRPIVIGKTASGDVNADGKVNMIDVIIAFQIATSNITPTQQQLGAANLDGLGKVTMIDVILLFQKVTQ